MKKYNLINTLLLVLGVLLISSCNKFLDREPLSDITPEAYLTDEAHLAAYTIERYWTFPTHGSWSFGTFGIDNNTDVMTNKYMNDRFNPGKLKVGSFGSWEFAGIYQANYFFKTVLPRWEAGTITGNAENVKHYIGEMYCIRAFEYFKKLQALGDFPIVTDILPDDKPILIESTKRMPRNEVARFILADLDKAIEYLSNKAPVGGSNRISKNVAYLLKSRVALYEGTWLKYFKGTAFVPNGPNWPGKTKDYNANYVFPTGSIEKEIEFFLDQAIAASDQVASTTPLVDNNGEIVSDAKQNPYYSMFSETSLTEYGEVLLWRKYDNALGITHNVPVAAQVGNYGNGLTRSMTEGFLMANGLPIYAAGSGYAGDNDIASVRKDRDGRLHLFLKEPGQVNCTKNVTVSTHITKEELVPLILISDPERTYSTGYAIRKGLSYDGLQCGNGGGYTGAIVFRATEAYLNYMEAYYERNGTLDHKAITYWQTIRSRAGVDTDLGETIIATNMSKEVLDWAAYSGGNLIDATLFNIRRERKNELMAEGHRFNDLKRWRAMDQLIQTAYHVEGFKLWGPVIQEWYKKDGASELVYGKDNDKANVSDPALSVYFRPHQIRSNADGFNGHRWTMAHYLEAISFEHFNLTGLADSPIYQNPNWPMEAGGSPF